MVAAIGRREIRTLKTKPKQNTKMSNTAITDQNKKPAGLKGLLSMANVQEQLARALPRHLTPDRFVRVAITALTRTPKLAECTQESFMKCLLDLSAMGLEPDGRRAHLIPYENRKEGIVECQLIVDYKGLVELIRRSGDVVSIRAETVCEKDGFSWNNGIVSHEVNWREDRGKVQAVYAESVMKSGEKQTAVMTLTEIEGIKKRSKASSFGPWVSDWSEMAKKTVVRRLSKMLPLSSEIMDHVTKDDDQFAMRNVTPAAPPAFILPDATPAIETPVSELPAEEWEGDAQ